MEGEIGNGKPWVCSGYSAEHEDLLIGNREGFRLLREKIDEALDSGGATISVADIEWAGLKLLAFDPRGKKEKRPRKDLVMLVAAGMIAFALLFVFVTGVSTIYLWIK